MFEGNRNLHKSSAFASDWAGIICCRSSLPLVDTLFTKSISTLAAFFGIFKQVLAHHTGEIVEQFSIARKNHPVK
jgi:hypothetical protein